MNTNDLPPAARLAVLIEAGRAANPDLEHGVRALIHEGRACALGFALLGAGCARNEMNPRKMPQYLGLYMPGSCPHGDPDMPLTWRVALMNDAGASLQDICQELREGELAKVAV